MTELQYNKVYDFIRSVGGDKSVTAFPMGYMVVLEEREGSHLFRSINVHPRHGEKPMDVVKDIAGMAKDYGIEFKPEYGL